MTTTSDPYDFALTKWEVENSRPAPTEIEPRRHRRPERAAPASLSGYEWMADAACRTPPKSWEGTRAKWVNQWFSDSPWVQREALRVCVRCDVRGDCVLYALNEGLRDGIYGGLTENQREDAARRRAG